MPTEEFIVWADRHRGEVTVVRNMLAQPLPSDVAAMKPHLIGVDGWCSRMETLLAKAEEYLVEAQEAARAGLTCSEKLARERWLQIAFATKLEVRVRDTIRGLCHCMKSRLMLGMSLMKTHNTELAAQL